MSDDTKWIIGIILGAICLITGIVYYDYSTITDTAEYYSKANTVCVKYKPAYAWKTTYAECFPVEEAK